MTVNIALPVPEFICKEGVGFDTKCTICNQSIAFTENRTGEAVMLPFLNRMNIAQLTLSQHKPHTLSALA